MPMDQEFVDMLRCPETRQPVTLAEAAVIDDLNRRIAEGTLVDRSGQPVNQPIDQGLVREDGQVLYPVRDEIPEMLIDSGIPMSSA